jgi:hypothetical protein
MSTLTDLNAKLFDQLNRLDIDNLTPERLKLESERSKIVVSIAKEIIDNKRLMLEITKHADECNLPAKMLPISLSSELE